MQTVILCVNEDHEIEQARIYNKVRSTLYRFVVWPFTNRREFHVVTHWRDKIYDREFVSAKTPARYASMRDSLESYYDAFPALFQARF